MVDTDYLFFLYNRGYYDMSELLQFLRCSLYSSRFTTDGSSSLRTLYKMIGHCRDIYKGKGERDLSYRMILTWFSTYPDLALRALRHLILDYGGWNDVKYFCLFVEKFCRESHKCPHGSYDIDFYEPLILSAISLANDELRFNLGSNVAKWIPRERSMTLELYDLFVSNWFDRKYVTNSMRKQYRKIVSNASAIIPSVTQRSIFRSIRPFSLDPTEISRTYEPAIKPGNSMFIGEYVKSALYASETDARWINMRWDVLIASFNECVSGIPVVDTDILIPKEHLYHAIGFACLIAQKSGAWRVLIASNKPIWIDLSPAAGVFTSMISILWEHCEIRTTSSFDLTFELIYQFGLYHRLNNQSLRLFVFSETFAFDWNIWLNRFSDKLPSASIIFWNIGTRVVIPDYLDDHKSLYLMSGYMPALIEPFCSSCISSWADSSRYDLMDLSFDTFFSGKLVHSADIVCLH